MLDHLIDFLRATLQHSRSADASHSLAQEFARLDDYLALMAIRMGPRLHYQLDLPPALASQPVAPMLLQPLVENSIVYGLEPLVAGGELTVRARQQDETLIITVADSGAGYTAGPQDAATGFGLQQVRERLHTLYGVRADFFIHAAPGGGTLATLRIPFQT
jgi:LytS/YehU family sensor histidine kinase